jgi:peptidoglycan/LPS O-acetylase OafA/YrhL
MTAQRHYFPNLNGIRFFAALLVIVHHIEQYKTFYGVDSYWDRFQFLRLIGPLGVILFFVLSGFLITYLLMAEEKENKQINIGHFYLRRVLRIWPLYFLVLLLAFLVFPQFESLHWPQFPNEIVFAHWPQKLLLFVFFLPNLVAAIYEPIPFASHTWSIGVEEQFYLAWPVLFRYLKRYRLALLVVIAIGHPIIGNFLASRYSEFVPHRIEVRTFWSSFNMNCMAIGSILGILLYQKHRMLNLLLHPATFYFAIVSTVGLIVWGGNVPYVQYEVYAILFGIIILHFAARKQLEHAMEKPWVHYLGKISYGLYMLHPICVALAIRAGISLGITTNWLLYPVAIALTITLASISYRFFESPFLRLKPSTAKESQS